MARLQISNEYIATQLGTLSAGATTMAKPTTVLGAAPASYPFLLTSRDGEEKEIEGVKEKTTGEVIEVTGESGSEWTIARGKEGTTGKEHAAGVVWALEINAALLEALLDTAEVEALALVKAGLAGGQTAHGGTAEADTLKLFGTSVAGALGLTLDKLVLTVEPAVVFDRVIEALGGIHGVSELSVTGKLEVGGISMDSGGVAYKVVKVPAWAATPEEWIAPSLSAWYTVAATVAGVEVWNLILPAPAKSGQLVRITNRGTQTITFVHNHEEPTFLEYFWFSTHANIILEPDHTLTLMFDPELEKWRDVALR